jgi:hypothetical protein
VILHSIRGRADHSAPMLYAILICSDPECPDELDALGNAPADFERLACDCGCTFQAIAFSEHVEARIPPTRATVHLSRAA